MTSRDFIFWLAFSLANFTLAHLNAAENTEKSSSPSTQILNEDFARAVSPLLQQLPPPAKHDTRFSQADAERLLRSDAYYKRLQLEKLDGRWFAFLVSASKSEPFVIQARFGTWRELVEFLAARNALVEVWTCGESEDHRIRRIPAPELAELKARPHAAPTLVTVAYLEPGSGHVAAGNLEFGFKAAGMIAAADRAYQRHRFLQLEAQKILGAKDAKGRPDARAQWDMLQAEVTEHRVSVLEMPAKPKDAHDIFVAFEFEVDEERNFSRIARVYPASGIEKRIVSNAEVQLLKVPGSAEREQVLIFGRKMLKGPWEPLSNPIQAVDTIELRVAQPTQPNPNRWNAVEFGEAELLKQSALAHFSMLNAYLERSRKARAIQQANVALVAEPIIAGLNIGGGIAGLGFPAGESARLLYNLITWKLISHVPNLRQMRELFALMAARDRDLRIKVMPERFLNQRDIEALRNAGAKLSDQEIQTYLEEMSEEDVRAMLRLARMGMIDARVTTFLNLLTSAFRVSGASDEAGPLRDLFNNVRFSMNGDVNLKTRLLLAIGQKGMTPLSGVSLEQLNHGQGPQQAWLQYLEISVDIRANKNSANGSSGGMRR